MQLLLSPDTDYELADSPGELAELEDPPLNLPDQDCKQHSVGESAPSRLSAIPEGSDEDAESTYSSFESSLPAYLNWCVDQEL